MNENPTSEVEPEAYAVTYAAGTRLEALHSAYTGIKAEADETSARLKAITDAIKAELTEAAPDERKVQLSGAAGPPLRLTYSESWRLDSTRLKREHPEIWVGFAKRSGSWRLAVGGV